MHNELLNSANISIVSIGDLVADLILSIPSLPVESEAHQLATHFQMEPGGSANLLIAGARLGLSMTAIGVLGDDVWGAQVLTILKEEGVKVANVRVEGETTCVTVLVAEEGDHVFLGKVGEGATLHLTQLDQLAIEAGDTLFLSGWALGEERLQSLIQDGIKVAHERQVPIFFDPGPMVKNVSQQVLDDLLPHVHTLLLTQDELSLLSHLAPAQLLTDPALNLQSIVIKRGEAGCTVWELDQSKVCIQLDVPGYTVPVVDISAAGDCFDAGWIAATLWGWPTKERAAFANACGAIVVQRLGGGRAAPTRAEVDALWRSSP
ncbi:MAG: carbohydrate kinase family protein [Chloroflexota bacterium]